MKKSILYLSVIVFAVSGCQTEFEPDRYYMDNVSDVPGFVNALKTAIKSDSQCRKLIQAVTIDESIGKNSLLRNKY